MSDQAWHTNKEIPIATIISIVLSVIAGSIWMANMRSDIDRNSDDIALHAVRDAVYQKEARATDLLILNKLDSIKDEISAMKVEQAERYGRYKREKGIQ